jgi:hypothetical protein
MSVFGSVTRALAAMNWEQYVYFADFLRSASFPEVSVKYVCRIFRKLTCRFSIKREYALRVNIVIFNRNQANLPLFWAEIVSKPLNLLLCKLLVVFQWTLSEPKEVSFPSSIKVIKSLATDSCRILEL